MKNRYLNKKGEIKLNRLNTLVSRIVFWTVTALTALTAILCVVWYALGKDTGKELVAHLLFVAAAFGLFNLPNILQNVFHVYVPTALHLFAYIFTFFHCIIGEIGGIYEQSGIFDKILHFISGGVCAGIGLSALNLANKETNAHQKLSPFCATLFAFCFSMMIAVLWEIFEFGFDSIFGTDMQRYEPPVSVVKETPPAQGYGLLDTMSDVLSACLAALTVSGILFCILRSEKKGLNRILMRKMRNFDVAIAEVEEAGDSWLADRLKRAKAAAYAQTDQVAAISTDGLASAESAATDGEQGEHEPQRNESEEQKESSLS